MRLDAIILENTVLLLTALFGSEKAKQLQTDIHNDKLHRLDYYELLRQHLPEKFARIAYEHTLLFVDSEITNESLSLSVTFNGDLYSFCYSEEGVVISYMNDNATFSVTTSLQQFLTRNGYITSYNYDEIVLPKAVYKEFIKYWNSGPVFRGAN